MQLLRRQPQQLAPTPEGRPTSRIEQAQHNPTETQPARTTPERAAEQPAIIERAKTMGRNVLRLVRRVRDDVEAADAREAVPIPTNVQPLAEADADVRAAVQELIAPIVATENKPTRQEEGKVAAEHTGRAASIEVSSPEVVLGSDADYGGSKSSSALEYASSVRTIAETLAPTGVAGYELAQEVAEKVKKPIRSAVRTAGVFALGAATAVGFAYTWHRMRTLRKEQRATQKQMKRLENEVRQHQETEETRIHRLEQTQVAKMDQPRRQEFVHEVSRFAHEQADEIRHVAYDRQQQPAPERLQPLATPAQPEQQPVSQPPSQERQPSPPLRQQERLLQPQVASELRTPEELAQAPTPERVPRTHERGSLIERLTGIVADRKDRATSAGAHIVSASGAPAGGFDANKPTARPTHQQPSRQPQKPRQPIRANAWLLYGLLVVGAIILLIIFNS